MSGAIEVSDSLSNADEQIERAAKAIGRGKARPAVFAAIYHHKSPVKAVSTVCERTGLSRMRVLQEGRHLVRKGIVRPAKKDGETAYQMIDVMHAHKAQIMRLAANPRLLAAFPTKRKGAVAVTVRPGAGAPPRARAVEVTVDDVDSFSAVRSVAPDGYIPRTISEDQFKRGIQAILNEPGAWRDWGGELFDLSTTRVVFNGKRVRSVFAFKGPGQSGPLVPKKMGKNGDQIPRMYLLDARLFVVQYGGEVKPSVSQLMRDLAVAKSAVTGNTIYYAVLDGVDSHRLFRAYRDKFQGGRKAVKRKRA